MKKYLSLLIFLTACAPVYKKFYAYEPMRTKHQQNCSLTCQSYKQSCINIQQQGYQSCLSDSRYQYQSCKAGETWGYDNKGNYECIYNCYCYETSCPDPDLDQCEAQYASCYTGCGGKVTETTRCVENCENEPKPTGK